MASKSLAALVPLFLATTSAKSGNMNGEYFISSGAKQKVPYNDDYASKGYEYFDVWGPEIATHYAEVFWTDQMNQQLPRAISERFLNKTIAIVGYEHDQVMVTPAGSPALHPELDVSVPMNWAYNHHYMMWITGKYATLQHITATSHDTTAHGGRMHVAPVDAVEAKLRGDPSIPTSSWFSEGNGGESRKSYHGYPLGFAQLIDCPDTWHVFPMQIDTRNRDCGVGPENVKNCSSGEHLPGPEPLQARWGRPLAAGTKVNVSGVLECPCNGRYGGDPSIYGATTLSKHNQDKMRMIGSPSCGGKERIQTAAACFDAAAAVGVSGLVKNVSTTDASLPTGCAVVSPQNAADVTMVYFNTQGKANCANNDTTILGTAVVKVGATAQVTVTASLIADPSKPATFNHYSKGTYCQFNTQNVLKSFSLIGTGEDAAKVALGLCEAYCKNEADCWGCSVDCPSGQSCRWSAIPDCGETMTWAGLIDGDISEKMPSGSVMLKVSGPATTWFGVGFNAARMADQPWTLIINDQGVSEQKLGTCGDEGDHCPGTALKSSVNVVSNTVANGVRIVVMTRDLVGATSDHLTFSFGTRTIRFITAVGSSQTFGYHAAHASSVISMTSPLSPTCICDGGVIGWLCNGDGTGCSNFQKDCVPLPDGDLAWQANPTCDSKTYVGGLSCCGHQRIMLDMDQEVRPELLRYHVKIRFWFQEYIPANPVSKTAASHFDLPRIYYQTESNAGEYDIPPAFFLPGQPRLGYPDWPANKLTPGTTCTGNCPSGSDCQCEHTITYHWTVPKMRLIYAGGHCHAPSCISMELYRNDTGTPELVCRQIPVYGNGDMDNDRFDDAMYLSLPPCLWGDDEGLEPSMLLPDNTPMISIKKNRNTDMGHFGDMASWQMRGVDF